MRRFQGVYGIGRPAGEASTDGANGLAFDTAGNLYLAGFNTKTLLMIDRTGRMRLPIGMTGFCPRGADGLTTTADGRVLAIETQRIVQLGPHALTTLDDFTHRRVEGITNFLPAGIAVTHSGALYTDTGYGNGWSNGSAIVEITPSKHIRALWWRQG